MNELFAIIRDAIGKRWSGEIRINVYFGAIKKVQIATTVNLELPVDMAQYKQKKPDPFTKVTGQ